MVRLPEQEIGQNDLHGSQYSDRNEMRERYDFDRPRKGLRTSVSATVTTPHGLGDYLELPTGVHHANADK